MVEYLMVFLGYLQVHVLILGYHILVYLDFQMLFLHHHLGMMVLVLIILMKLLLSALALLYYLVFAHFLCSVLCSDFSDALAFLLASAASF